MSNYFKKSSPIFFSILIVLSFSLVAAQSPRKEEVDLAQSITLSKGRQSLGAVFRELMSKYKIPIGFEESTLDKDHDDYDFDTILPFDLAPENRLFENGMRFDVKINRVFTVEKNWIQVDDCDRTLYETFDMIVGQMKNYKWEVKDGAINIIPIRGRDSRFEELLNLQVTEFAIESGAPYGIIRSDIIGNGEVKKFLQNHSLKISIWRKDGQYARYPIPEGKNFKNLTIRELFNRIAIAKRGGWILKSNKVFKDKEKYIELSI